MLFRQLVRLTTITAFILFAITPTTQAQRMRNTVIYENLQTGQISGKITNDAGPLEGAEVALHYHGKAIGHVVTKADGTYNFKELRAGKYDISCVKDGYRKRIVYEVPVLETYLTHNDLDLARTNTWYNARKANILYYEDRKNARIEKMQ